MKSLVRIIVFSLLFVALRAADAQQDNGMKCATNLQPRVAGTPPLATQRACSNYQPKPLRRPVPKAQLAAPACTITQNPSGPIPVGEQVTFTASSQCGSQVTFALNCWGASNCGQLVNQSGSSITYIPPPNVPVDITYKGTVVSPNSSIINVAATRYPVDANSPQWIARLQQLGSSLTFNFYPGPGLIAEFVNPTNGQITQVNHPYEGGFNWDGVSLPVAIAPYHLCQSGCSMAVVNEPGGTSLDNHNERVVLGAYQFAASYKDWMDFQKQTITSCVTKTCIAFQTDFRDLPVKSPYPIWIWRSSCQALNSGDNGFQATVVTQPSAANGYNGVLSVPVNTTSCPIGAAVASAVNEGNESPDGYNKNTQSAGLWSAASNAILGGPNAAQMESVHADLAQAYDRYLNPFPDTDCGPNCTASKVVSWPHGIITTMGNEELSSDVRLPALVDTKMGGGPCNVTYEHPCYPIAGATQSGTTITLTLGENFNDIGQLCSGVPIWSKPNQTCTAGMQFYWTFPTTSSGLGFPTSSPWSALNGLHVLATATDSSGTKFSFTGPANLGPLPTTGGLCNNGNYCTWYDALPYGVCLLQTNYQCSNLCNDGTNSCTLAQEMCNSLATRCTFISDGTDENFGLNSDISVNGDLPPWVFKAFGYLSNMQCKNQHTGGAAMGAQNCFTAVDISSALVNGIDSGATANGYITLTATGSQGNATAEVYPVGNVADFLNNLESAVAIPNTTYPSDAYSTGNVNALLTFKMRPEMSDIKLDANTGAYTTTTARTAKESFEIDACPQVLPPYGQCGHKWVTVLPQAPDGSILIWPGGDDSDYSGCNRYTGPDFKDEINTSYLWNGTIPDSNCKHDWQTQCMIPQNDAFAELLGSYRAHCASWSAVKNAPIYSGAQGNNDQETIVRVPNQNYNVWFNYNAGYNATGPGQTMIRLLGGGSFETAATVLADNVDEYASCGGSYKPCTLGPYIVSVTDTKLYLLVQTLSYSTTQYEGPEVGSWKIQPAGPPTCSISISPTTLSGVVGQPFSTQLVANGTSTCAPPYIWKWDGNLQGK